MFILFKQFLHKEAVRDPIYLLNPPVVKEENIQIPRLSVIHLLEQNTDSHFPLTELKFLNNIRQSKKIPIFILTDLYEKNFTSSLNNKLIKQEVTQWVRDNIKRFKPVNLIENPNTDINLISIFNYNLLKDLYKYSQSNLINYYRYNNLYRTYWYYVKESIKVNSDSYQFVKIKLPKVIPSYNIFELFNKYKTVKLFNIITDSRVLNILDIYRWLDIKNREKSTLSDITDSESNNIIIEFTYEGYSAFLPLSIIRKIAKDSELEYTNKLPNEKVKKIFVTFLFKFQKKVEEIIDEDLKEEEKYDIDETNEKDNEELDSNYKDDNEKISLKDIVERNTYTNKDKTNDSVKYINKLYDEIDDINNLEENTNIENMLDDLETDTSYEISDKIYLNEISKSKEEEEENTSDNDNKDVIYNVTEEELNDSLEDKDLYKQAENFITTNIKFKLLSSNEVRKIRKLLEQRKELKSPYNDAISLDNFKTINEKELELTDEEVKLDFKNSLVDPSLKKEILNKLDNKYRENILYKDIIGCVSSLEKHGIIIKNYEIEESKSILGKHEVHKLTIKPLSGKESTIYFRIPKVDSEGNFYVAGVKLFMRRQRTDLPIRKITPIKVSLTSNYGKLFIQRTERKAYNSELYLVDTIKKMYLDSESSVINIKPGNTYNNLKNFSNIYSYFSQHFKEIETKKYKFIFDYKARHKYLKDEVVRDLDAKILSFIGYIKNSNDVLVIDDHDIIHNYSKDNEVIGTLPELLDIKIDKIPKSFSTIKILGLDIPLGIVMSYYLGISKLIAATNTSYNVIPSNKQYKSTTKELVLRFKDFKLILKTDTVEKELIFNGFLFYKDIIKNYSLEDFNFQYVYLDIIEYRNGKLSHIKELNILRNLFLDSITIDVLKSINEPTDFLKLLLRANELLKDFSHPDPNDPKYSRIRGLDRIPGLMYKALTESIRQKEFSNSQKIELDPYKVWTYLTTDNSVKITEDNNPITNLKEKEVVTFTGLDGLNKTATPAILRRYHKNDMGLISEATVDSGDVALNIYLTPFAKFKNIRGLIKDHTSEFEDNPAKIFSTSVMIAPGSDQDDPKRINFVSIQNGHTIASKGYHQSLLRTEYEYVIPYRVGSLYANHAEKNGKVIDKTDKLLIVKYEDDVIKSYPLGYRYGKMEGATYPHKLITNFNKGDKVKKNDFLTYNENFFEQDWLDKNNIMLKFSRNLTVALTMNNEVFEDSSAISEKASKEMSSNFIKEKSFIIEFNKNIHNLVPEGTDVTPDTILFTLSDSELEDTGNLNESTIEILQSLTNLSPKAKVNGTVVRYEIRYNGEKQDMSPSLRKLANKLDKEVYEETKGTENEASNNQVSFEYRVDGKNLQLDTLELKVFIMIEVTQAIGDKGVFANQMKTVLSDVYSELILTEESNEQVDGMFSYKGILNRIVNSPILIGTTNRLIKQASKNVVDIYFK